MQRSIASILLLVASVAFGLSAGCWWLQRTVFTPADSPSIAAAVLDQSAIRLEIITVVSARTAGALGTTPDTLANFLDTEVLSKQAGAAELAPFIERAHLRAIGSNDDLIVIVGHLGPDRLPYKFEGANHRGMVGAEIIDAIDHRQINV